MTPLTQKQVRTELSKLENQGYIVVARRCVGDAKTCPLCKELSESGSNIYRISDLLALDRPLTQDPHTEREVDHEGCRCTFVPLEAQKFLDDV